AGEGLDLGDALLVARGHRRHPVLPPVERPQPDVVAADDEEVGHGAAGGVLLEAGQLREQPGQHLLDDAVLLLGGERHLAPLLGSPPLAVELPAQDRARHLTPVDGIERRQALLGPPGGLLANLGDDDAAELLDAGVDHEATSVGGAAAPPPGSPAPDATLCRVSQKRMTNDSDAIQAGCSYGL